MESKIDVDTLIDQDAELLRSLKEVGNGKPRKRGRPRKKPQDAQAAIHEAPQEPQLQPAVTQIDPEKIDSLEQKLERLTQDNMELRAQLSGLVQVINTLAGSESSEPEGLELQAEQQPDEDSITLSYNTDRPVATAPLPFGNDAQPEPGMPQPAQSPVQVIPNPGVAAPPAHPQPVQAPSPGPIMQLTDLIALATQLKQVFDEPKPQQQPLQQIMTGSIMPFLEMFQMFSQIMGTIRETALKEASESSKFYARVAKGMGKEFMQASANAAVTEEQGQAQAVQPSQEQPAQPGVMEITPNRR